MHLLLYYITDRNQFPGTSEERRARLLAKIAEAAGNGVDFIQLREKDLSVRELEQLTLAASATIAQYGQRPSADSSPKTRLLVNSRADVAFAGGADGVHLPAGDLSPIFVRRAWEASARKISLANPRLTVAVSCHSLEEVERAAVLGADLVVYGPIFSKAGWSNRSPRILGLEALEAIGPARIPVFALGGITAENGPGCLRAGASGLAAIRMFQQNDIHRLIGALGERRQNP